MSLMYNSIAGEHVNSARSRLLQKAYGITIREYRALFAKQGGKCAICKVSPPGGMFDEHAKAKLHVDHDHKTGEVRGLLCNGCNVGLGMFRDDPTRLQRAIEYLGGGLREAPKQEQKQHSKRAKEFKRRRELKKLIVAQRRDQSEMDRRFRNAVD